MCTNYESRDILAPGSQGPAKTNRRTELGVYYIFLLDQSNISVSLTNWLLFTRPVTGYAIPIRYYVGLLLLKDPSRN